MLFDYGTRRVALGTAAAALLALVSACATPSPAQPAAEARADVLRAEIKEKTYDLELDRVTSAVRTYLGDSGGRILSEPSPDDLLLQATVPVNAATRSTLEDDAEWRNLRYEVSFELVVEGVTVRVQAFFEGYSSGDGAERGAGRPAEIEELYRQFFAGVDARL